MAALAIDRGLRCVIFIPELDTVAAEIHAAADGETIAEVAVDLRAEADAGADGSERADLVVDEVVLRVHEEGNVHMRVQVEARAEAEADVGTVAEAVALGGRDLGESAVFVFADDGIVADLDVAAIAFAVGPAFLGGKGQGAKGQKKK